MPPPDRTRNGSRWGTPVQGCAWFCVMDESVSLPLRVCDGAGVVAGVAPAGVALTMAAALLRVAGAGATSDGRDAAPLGCGFNTRVGGDRRKSGRTTLKNTTTKAATTSRPTTRG